MGGVLSLLVICNLLISPINWDGTKNPYWGNYFTDISEHYYPYKETVIWLKSTYPNEKVLFYNLNNYYLQFYFNRFKWDSEYGVNTYAVSKNDPDNLANAIPQAESENDLIIVYPVLGYDIPKLPVVSNYHEEKNIGNQAHQLVIYRRNQN